MPETDLTRLLKAAGWFVASKADSALTSKSFTRGNLGFCGLDVHRWYGVPALAGARALRAQAGTPY
jgi:hypothetical protein